MTVFRMNVYFLRVCFGQMDRLRLSRLKVSSTFSKVVGFSGVKPLNRQSRRSVAAEATQYYF